MRYSLLASAVLAACVLTVASAETPAPDGVVVGAGDAVRPAGIKRRVYLDHLVLQEMQKSDPARYAQVRSIRATATEICGSNAGRQWSVANVSSARCSSMFLKTSYPPKREIGFQIEDTWYIALVTVRDKPVLLIGGPDRVVPVEPHK
jgi:hypothetical protein